MKPTTIEYIKHHSATGIWTGPEVDGVASIRYQGKMRPVEPYLKDMGIKIRKADKYKERLEDAGMGEPHAGGHTPDAGNGISQEQE